MIAMWIGRSVFQNRYNRTLMIAFALSAAGILASEACLWLLGASPSAGMTAGFLIMAMSGAHLAAAVDRRFAIAAAQFLACGLASALAPRYSVDLAALSLLTSHLTLAFVWHREARAPSKPGA